MTHTPKLKRAEGPQNLITRKSYSTTMAISMAMAPEAATPEANPNPNP